MVLGLAVLEKLTAGWNKEGIASKWGWKTNTGTLSRKEFVKHLLKMKNTGEVILPLLTRRPKQA